MSAEESAGAPRVDPQIAWAKGGHAQLVRLDGDVVVLRSTTSSPPGSRPEGRLGTGATVRVKVHGSKKQEDGAFRLEGRMIDLTRALRAVLEALLPKELP